MKQIQTFAIAVTMAMGVTVSFAASAQTQSSQVAPIQFQLIDDDDDDDRRGRRLGNGYRMEDRDRGARRYQGYGYNQQYGPGWRERDGRRNEYNNRNLRDRRYDELRNNRRDNDDDD